MKNLKLTILLALAFFFSNIQIASADVGGLVKCSDSAAFNKRLNASVKKLEVRANKYENDSPPALALQQQIERTKARFDK